VIKTVEQKISNSNIEVKFNNKVQMEYLFLTEVWITNLKLEGNAILFHAFHLKILLIYWYFSIF